MALSDHPDSASSLHFVLVDANAPWVRALFQAMPSNVSVTAFRTQGPAQVIRHPIRFWRDQRLREINARWHEQTIVVPSWSRLPKLTTQFWARRIKQRLADRSREIVMVYCLPYYAGLVTRFPTIPQVYFAFDPYACYSGWDSNVVATGERHLLTHCDAAFGISQALADDFRKITDRPIFVQPNGISQSFVQAFDSTLSPPDDLPAGGPPVVGCVGQIGRAYDWDLLDAIVPRCPNLRFVFIGPVFDEGHEVKERMARFCGHPNVVYLGAKPHDEVPRYIQRFDVCLIPLRPDPCNHRRSLLRVFDYIASGRPIVSMAVASALEHRQWITICDTTQDIVDSLQRICANPVSPVDRKQRREYLAAHTWEARAQTFLGNLRSAIATRQGRP